MKRKGFELFASYFVFSPFHCLHATQQPSIPQDSLFQDYSSLREQRGRLCRLSLGHVQRANTLIIDTLSWLLIYFSEI